MGSETVFGAFPKVEGVDSPCPGLSELSIAASDFATPPICDTSPEFDLSLKSGLAVIAAVSLAGIKDQVALQT